MLRLIKNWLDKPFFLTTWPAFLWAIFIFVLSVIQVPQPKRDLVIPHLDKIVHFVLYFILMILALKGNTNANLKLGLLTFSVIIYGVFIELVQHYFVINRFFDFWDIAANTAGTLLGLILGRQVLKY